MHLQVSASRIRWTFLLFPYNAVLRRRVLRWEEGGIIWLLIVTAVLICFLLPPPFKMLHREHLPVIKIFFKNVTWMAAWHLSSECPITVCVSDSNCVGLEWMAPLKSRAVLGSQGGICSPHSKLREASLPYSVCLDQGIGKQSIREIVTSMHQKLNISFIFYKKNIKGLSSLGTMMGRLYEVVTPPGKAQRASAWSLGIWASFRTIVIGLTPTKKEKSWNVLSSTWKPWPFPHQCSLYLSLSLSVNLCLSLSLSLYI